jgi:Protein of unknown function (DUF4199)
MRKEILRYGLGFGSLAGVGCFLFFLAFYALTSNPLMIKRPDIGINIILIWAGIWYFKRYNGGVLHFYQGFSIGFLINIIGALVSGVLIYLFIEFVDIAPYNAWIAESKALLLRDKEAFTKIMNPENFKRQLVSLENSKTYQVILDDLMFKQLAIIPLGLLTMAMRKINN